MAKDERPTAAEKGKGKADDVRESNGDKNEGKDGKPVANGKNEEEQKEGWFKSCFLSHSHHFKHSSDFVGCLA